MIDVEIKMTEPETVAYLPMRGPYTQIPEAMGRLYGWVAQHGLQPVGMPQAVYYTAPQTTAEEEAEWELQAPVAGASEQPLDADGCGVKLLPATQIACAVHRGPYESIADTYGDLQAWVATNGYVMTGAPGEVYLSDPEKTAPEDYRTEVRFPVAKA